MYYCSEVIYIVMIPNILIYSNENKGSSLSLPAHGRAGARATSSLAAHFAKRNTKFGGGGKARAGKNSFPPTPFFFARPSENYQKSASGFSRKKVRILFKTDSTYKISPIIIGDILYVLGLLNKIRTFFQNNPTDD